MSPREKSRSSRMPVAAAAPGKHQMPTSAEPMSEIEGRLISGLDLEKLSDLAEVLFALNNYRTGPIPGFYVAIEVTPGEEWCVGQLCADRAKPLKIFDQKVYKKPESAKRAAERCRARELDALSVARTTKKVDKKKATDKTLKGKRRRVVKSSAKTKKTEPKSKRA